MAKSRDNLNQPKVKSVVKIPQGLAEQAQLDINSSWDYVNNTYTKKWDQAWKLYNNDRVMVNYQSTSKSFDPMAYNAVETNIANVFGNKPRVVYLPTQLEQQKETRVLNQMFNYTWDKNNLSYHVIPFGRSLYVTGNATIWSTWDEETDWIKAETRAVRDCIFDPNAKNPWQMRYGGYRELIMIDDLKDVKMLDSESGEWKPKYQNLDNVTTWTNGDNQDIDKQVKDCYVGSLLDGNAKRNQAEIVTLYYIRGKYAGKVVEIANRSTVIYFGDSQFQKKAESKKVKVAQYGEDGTPKLGPDGKPVFSSKTMDIPEIRPFIPVAFQRNNTDESLLYGMGEIEPMADLQEMLNDTINMKRDNMVMNITTQFTLDPKFQDMAPKIKNIPGAIYNLPAGALTPIQKPDMTAAADVEIHRLQESIRMTTGMDEVVSGLQPQSKATATQINTQLNQAGQRFGTKLQLLENESYRELADQWFKLFQIFVTQEQVVRVTGRKGVDWLKLDPDMYWGSYEPSVQLEQNAKAMVQDEIKRIEAAANIFLNNPYVDQRELTRIVAQRVLEFDDDEADTLLVKDEDLGISPGQGNQMPGAPMGQMPPGMAGMPGMPPQGMPQGAPQQQAAPMPLMPNGQLPANPSAMPQPAPAPSDGNNGPKTIMERIIENIDYADLPEDIKRQVEQQLGFTPSNMASPVQQKVNIEGLKLHQNSSKLAADHSMNVLDHTKALDQQNHQQGMDALQFLASQQQAQQQLQPGMPQGQPAVQAEP